MDGMRLLVCDDPSLALEENLPLLRALGLDCTYVQEVREIDVEQVRPDAILLSAEVPGGCRGFACQHLRQTFPQTPILAVAHMRSLAGALAWFRAGVADYLPAPLREAEVKERLDAVLKRCGEDAPVRAAPPRTEPTARVLLDRDGLISTEALACGLLAFHAGGELLAANQRALKMLGFDTIEDLADTLKKHMDTLAPISRDRKPLNPNNWPINKSFREKTAQAATVGIRRPDGKWIWLRIEAKPVLENGAVALLAATLTNLTDEFRARGRKKSAKKAKTSGK